MASCIIPLDSPFGWLHVWTAEGTVRQITLPTDSAPSPITEGIPADAGDLSRRTIDALNGYFAGVPIPVKLADELVDRLPHHLPDGTSISLFYRRIWKALATVPFGETVSYRSLAVTSGAPAATRAVGSAMARNPLPIIVPCHRVIRSDGGLGGYSGGLDMKLGLLRHEGIEVL